MYAVQKRGENNTNKKVTKFFYCLALVATKTYNTELTLFYVLHIKYIELIYKYTT